MVAPADIGHTEMCDVMSHKRLFHLELSAKEETGCSVSRNLPVHAGLATIWCEATATT
jgi:hypothetical protein